MKKFSMLTLGLLMLTVSMSNLFAKGTLYVPRPDEFGDSQQSGKVTFEHKCRGEKFSSSLSYNLNFLLINENYIYKLYLTHPGDDIKFLIGSNKNSNDIKIDTDKFFNAVIEIAPEWDEYINGGKYDNTKSFKIESLLNKFRSFYRKTSILGKLTLVRKYDDVHDKFFITNAYNFSNTSTFFTNEINGEERETEILKISFDFED